ncbi:hypothetical protein ACOTJG_13410 [Achromobacter xylosoxidans]
MNRRRFIAAGATLFAFPAIAGTRPPTSIRDAYTLWYNRPSAIVLPSGLGFGFITSEGNVEVAQLDQHLQLRGRHRLYSFNHASDHGSPALLRIPAGAYQGHTLACFSNHASELFITRTERAEDVAVWGPVKSLDEGRCTYVSLGATPDGVLILMYTLQRSCGGYERGQWRETLFTTSIDGGDTWDSPKSLIAFGPGTFPYSTPFSLSKSGLLATSYALFSYDQQRHMGLAVAIANIDTGRVETTTVISTGDANEIIPYETRWDGDDIYLSYSRVSGIGATAFTARVDRETDYVKSTRIGAIATHGYASGAALSPDCKSVFYAPPSGGLKHKSLINGHSKHIFHSGHYSMPFTMSSQGKDVLGVSKDQVVRSSRSFEADLTILYV